MPTDRQKFEKLQREILEIVNGILDIEGDEYIHKLIKEQLELFDKHYNKYSEDEILLLAEAIKKKRSKN